MALNFNSNYYLFQSKVKYFGNYLAGRRKFIIIVSISKKAWCKVHRAIITVDKDYFS